jgi:hypothetical protein
VDRRTEGPNRVTYCNGGHHITHHIGHFFYRSVGFLDIRSGRSDFFTYHEDTTITSARNIISRDNLSVLKVCLETLRIPALLQECG